jgi:hypothetical protein
VEQIKPTNDKTKAAPASEQTAVSPGQPPVSEQHKVGGQPPVGEQHKVGGQPPVVKKFGADDNTKMKVILTAIIVVIAGVGTGYTLSSASAESTSPTPTSNVADESSGGVNIDESMFSDTATGVLNEGGIEGEGTHYLDTGLGEEKYVYLLSTVLDLDPFIGKKVEVQGQTLAAENAGWLMDVGKIKEAN